MAEAAAEAPVPQWGPVTGGPVVPRHDSAPRGSAPVAGQAWLPESIEPGGDVDWDGVTPGTDEADDSEPDEERSYSVLHWLVLLFLALVLGALVYLLMNQATGGAGSQSSASALLGTSLSHQVAFRSS